MDDPTSHELRELGVWWLPSDRDRRVAGILTYTPDRGAELELIGSLNSPPDSSPLYPGMLLDEDFESAGDYGRICGLAGSRAFTLEGCFQLHATNVLAPEPGSSVERIYVNRVVRGAEFEEGEEIDTTRVDVRLLHLPYWIAEGGVAEKHFFPDKAPEGESQFTLGASLLPDRTIELDDGHSVSFCETITIAGDRVTERALRRAFWVRIEGPRKPLAEYISVVADVQDLVSVGLDRTATTEAFEFHHPDIVHKLPKGESRSTPIDLFAQWLTWESRDPQPPKFGERLFTFDELGGEDPVRRWLAFVSGHRGTVSRFMATRYRTDGYVSDRLLNRAATLEALDRDTHGKDGKHFIQRMVRLADLAGEPFLDGVGNKEAWARRFRDRRVAAAHHSNDRPENAGQTDHLLAEAAYYLFVLCLLRHAGAAETAFERVSADQGFLRTMRRLRLSAAND